MALKLSRRLLNGDALSRGASARWTKQPNGALHEEELTKFFAKLKQQ
jgi:hypothetical protein